MERPPHDRSLLRRAMLMSIAERLQAECDPPTDLTPELRNILRRLEERKERRSKRDPIPRREPLIRIIPPRK